MDPKMDRTKNRDSGGDPKTALLDLHSGPKSPRFAAIIDPKSDPK